MAAEEHEDLVFNASGGICGQTDIFFRFIAGNSFDEADGSNRNQVVLVYVGGVVFL